MANARPRVDCPHCTRRVSVTRADQQIHPHDKPGGGRCPGSWVRVDLYGLHEAVAQ
jgi:hypothetical protein